MSVATAAMTGPVGVTPALSGVALYAIGFALLVIVAIGLELILRKPGRRSEDRRDGGREDGAGDRRSDTALPPGVDPVNLRRRRPRTQRLTGAVLLAAALVLVLALRPLLRLA